MNLKWIIALGLLSMLFLAGCPKDSGNPNESRTTKSVDGGGGGDDDSGSSSDAGGE